ncbi:MAG: hypothetical protein J6T56_07180 [Bacteroidales bacterium]|nr:hypothetical protein [Bacteroidales bacterium]
MRPSKHVRRGRGATPYRTNGTDGGSSAFTVFRPEFTKGFIISKTKQIWTRY